MLQQRIEKLREIIKKKGIDAVLLISNPNRNYMTGFTGDESFAILTLDKGIFITDSRYTEQAQSQVEYYEVRQYKGAIADYLNEVIDELNIRTLGFEEDILTFKEYSTYKAKFKCELIPMEGMVEKLRLIKDSDEISAIKRAAAIADNAFAKILQFVKPGMTEREVGVELEYWLKRFGGSGLSFPSIVASGGRSSLPHGQPTEKVIKMGDFLTLDFGCIYNDYCSDMTRTIVMGNATDKMLEIYNIVLEAQEAALKAFKPGVTGADVDKVARDIIKQRGYGEYFGHGLGHGVGRQIHEEPRVSPMGNTVLEPGMVVTDEPGIYIPDFGGVRIEDLVLITENGCEILSKSPKSLITI
ncbi:Xaa-Pro peptidase family protein [Clostridium sp. BSD9I1]|uniref:M24 family metallopeptidase n=1 Tax=Clostridium sp. BSD9I1 TaxID=2003589 RepID=UPI001649518A|nr:Xaa-Pro peptidase family protein [Clostridium sp. BSD9I1]